MDEKGEFSERLIKDVEIMLSLYEATHMMVHRDDTLEKALAFTTFHLESVANQSSHSNAIQVKHNLRQSLHKNYPRLEAHKFIFIYEKDRSHNEILLNLEKLDFNMLQNLIKRNLVIFASKDFHLTLLCNRKFFMVIKSSPYG